MEGAIATTEMAVLGWSVVLLLVQVVLQASAGLDLGPRYLFSPRDEKRESKVVVAGRLQRALRNFLETYPAFVALALALVVTGKAGGLGAPAPGSGWWRASSMWRSMRPASLSFARSSGSLRSSGWC